MDRAACAVIPNFVFIETPMQRPQALIIAQRIACHEIPSAR
jgi:hypothetical protein